MSASFFLPLFEKQIHPHLIKRNFEAVKYSDRICLQLQWCVIPIGHRFVRKTAFYITALFNSFPSVILQNGFFLHNSICEVTLVR